MKINPLPLKINSLINIAGGGIMAFYAFISPLILSRILKTEDYSAYILGTQAIPFLLLLISPFYGSLAPRFAQLISENDTETKEKLTKSAFIFFNLATIAAISACFILARILPSLLSWNSSFSDNATTALVTIGISYAMMFPAFLISSYAAGNQNYTIDFLLKCTPPYLMIIIASTWWFLNLSNNSHLDLERIIAAHLISSTIICSISIIKILKFIPRIHISDINTFFSTFKTLGINIKGTYWWQLCALVCFGAGPFIASNITSTSAASYGIANSMMMVVAGIASALAGPISIRAASRFNSDKFKQILDFTSFQKKYLIFIFTSTATIIAIPESVLTSWVGSDLGKEIYQIKAALALGHFLRQITAPYGMMLTGLRLEKMIWKSPFIEATTSVICGYILGIYFGVQGVAFGFTIAATFRLTLTLIHDLNITSNHLRLTAMHLIFPWLVK